MIPTKQHITIRPKLIRDIVLYEPPEGTTGKILLSILETISTHSVTIKSLKPQGVFLSFKNILSLTQENAKIFIDTFTKLNLDTKLAVGAVNYNSKVFHSLEELTFNSSLILAKNINIAAIFLNTIQLTVHDSILLFDEDKEASGVLYSEFISSGLSVVLAKNRQDFKEKAQTNSFTYKIFESRKNDKSISVTTGFKAGYYFYNFRGYLNDSIALEFDLKSHKQRLEEGFKAFFLDFSKVVSFNKNALKYFIEIGKITQKLEGNIYIHTLKQENIESDHLEAIKDNQIKIFGTQEQCFKHANAKGLIHKTRDLGDLEKISISKDSITKMPTYIKTTIDVLKNYGYNEKEKIAVKPKITSVSAISQQRVGVISFDGDLNATLMLFFTNKQLQVISQNMFGAPVNSDEELKDLVAEVMNTIGGQIKLVTSNMDIPMSISLPESFLSRDRLISFLGDRKGISVTFTFNKEPVELFLIGSVLLEVL